MKKFSNDLPWVARLVVVLFVVAALVSVLAVTLRASDSAVHAKLEQYEQAPAIQAAEGMRRASTMQAHK